MRHSHAHRTLRHWVGGGDVNVHVNLRHSHAHRTLRHWVGGGDVNVHVNLRHMHIARYVTGFGGLTNVLGFHGFSLAGIIHVGCICKRHVKEMLMYIYIYI